MVILIVCAFFSRLRVVLVPIRSITRSFRFGCFIVKPPKLSPLCRSNNSNSCPTLGKPSCQNPTVVRFANPVVAWLAARMLKIRHLKAVRIEKRLDCFSKTHFVFAYIVQLLCRVPLKLHARTLPQSHNCDHARLNHTQVLNRGRCLMKTKQALLSPETTNSDLRRTKPSVRTDTS